MLIEADGSDGFYADHQAEAALLQRGHSLHFHKHGSDTCWNCGRFAQLQFLDLQNHVWELSGKALDEPCDYEPLHPTDAEVGFAGAGPGLFVVLHSVNGATYGPPVEIDRVTGRYIYAGQLKFSRKTGEHVGSTCYYCRVVRRKAH